MRLPLVLAALVMSVPAASQAPPRPDPHPDGAAAEPAVLRVNPVEADKCRKTRAHSAKSVSEWIGEPIAPRKLDELPPAIGYMAVYRTINGCEMPLTVVDYRNSTRR